MDEYRSCRNKCMFCFIDQMPKGMRETLYFKDDDSRLSFLQGNYITLDVYKRQCLLFWGKKYGKFVLSKTAGISPYLMPSENLVVPKASFSGAKSTACNLKIISL